MRKVLYLLVAMLLLGKLDAASACRFYAGSKQHPGGPQEQLYEQASTNIFPPRQQYPSTADELVAPPRPSALCQIRRSRSVLSWRKEW